ncbi:MAG: PfkB family carbohydrate kinase, partial [Candidatus Cloacimonadaceae bacterium]
MPKMQVLCQAFKGLKVIVLGDIMLDSYQWGKVQRISPEAPVPVIEINREEYRLGGAANVALNIASLGAEVYCVGLTGKDSTAKIIHKLFNEKGLNTEGLVADAARKSTIKTRIGAVNQQIVRIDIEDTFYPNEKISARLIKSIKKELKNCDFLVIEDYNKGLLSPEIISATLKLCKEYRVGVSVDPKQKNFFAYEGVEIFKPNYKELMLNLGL